MKKIYSAFVLFALAALASCNKPEIDFGENSVTGDLSGEITLSLGEAVLTKAGSAEEEEESYCITPGWVTTTEPFEEADTKATAVTAIPSSLYWGGTTGSGTEALQWASSSAAVSGGKINTGKMQTSTPTTYNYYVSNVSLSVGANTTVSASNTTDVIVGRVSSNSTTPAVTLNHIFARVCGLTFQVPSGYTGSEIVWSIIGKSTINGTAGTYNLRTGAWTVATTKLTSYTQLSSSTVSQQTASQTVDMYLIPGTYTIKVVFKLTKSGITKTFTQTGDITIVQGKKNNITANPATGVGTGIDDNWDDGNNGNL